MSRAIFILSLPRSGSSCIAGALHRMGVDMGEGHWQPLDASNPRGYYEDLRWQALNKDLAGYGYSARSVYWLPDQHRAAYRRLFELCSQEPTWGVKAPRMAFTFKHFISLAREFCEVRVVVIERDLDDVVASMKRHSEVAYDGTRRMSDAEASALIQTWQAALLDAIKTFRGPTCVVTYDDVIEKPETALRDLAKFCFEGKPMPDLKEAIEWVDPEMRHHAASSSRR